MAVDITEDGQVNPRVLSEAPQAQIMLMRIQGEVTENQSGYIGSKDHMQRKRTGDELLLLKTLFSKWQILFKKVLNRFDCINE